MKKSIIVGLSVAIFCLGVVACGRFNAQPTKWEYEILNFDSDSQAQLNKLGKDGWELVSIHVQESNGSEIGFGKCYLKRPLAQ